MKQHFVIFHSPGTLFCEETTLPIDSWDVEVAKSMARGVVERYGATPFCFQFMTRERSEEELDSHQSARSGRYFLGGRILNREQAALEFGADSILLRNMRSNGWDQVVVNDNSWRSVQPLQPDDVVLVWERGGI